MIQSEFHNFVKDLLMFVGPFLFGGIIFLANRTHKKNDNDEVEQGEEC
jgi:hypothetical protein